MLSKMKMLAMLLKHYRHIEYIIGGGVRASWSSSYGSWIYDYMCNQCLSPVVRSNPMYSMQHYVIKLVSDLRQVGGFFLGTPFSFINKPDRHDITEILLKETLNTIN